MAEYRQLTLFDEYSDNEAEENLVEEIYEYTLYQHEGKNPGEYEYQVFDPYGVSVAKWGSRVDALSLSTSDYKRSGTRHTFMKIINQEKDKAKKASAEIAAKERAAKRDIDNHNANKKTYNYRDDDDDVSWYNNMNANGTYRYSSYSTPYSSNGGYSYQPKPKSTGFLDKLNKSDTLVVHCADRSTDMLSQIYAGKNWDVLRDGNIDKNELHELIKSHDRIVCLGHGTSSGLINVQGGGSVIGSDEAPLLKDKKLFVIWCNADAYFEKHGIGNGQFITGNMPSEVWECRAAGCGEISSQLMLENITYWSKLCADVVEKALNGDAQGAVNYVRDKYIEKYGDHPVTIYNAERTKVQGKPLDDLSDKYWGPEELLHPKQSQYSYTYTSDKNAQSSKSYDPHVDPHAASEVKNKPKTAAVSNLNKNKLGKYEANNDIEDQLTGSDLYNYIDWVESLLSEEIEYADIDYWTEIEDGDEVLIMVVTMDGEELYYQVDGDDIIAISW